jgi:PqqD family protein of HPr-rel-A system
MSRNPHVRWCAAPADALAWREWNGEIVVFNQATGSTHLLGALGGELFRRLLAADRGATIEALAAGLAAESGDTGDDADWTGTIAEALAEFARLGLARAEAP